MVRRWVVAAALTAAATSCATDPTPSPDPSPATATASSTTPPTPTTTALPTTAPTAPTSASTTATATSASAALAFFRAQEGPCQAFSRQMGYVGVEPDRFRGASVVRELGNGATQIRDGRGTRLVVVPRRGIVLPASGRPDDVMPPPYEYGCSEKVFVGASHD